MQPPLFDTHCHLTFPGLFERRQQVIADAVAAGVSRMIEIACTPADLGPAMQLRREFPGQVLIGAGIHPHEAGKVTDADLERFARLWHEESGVVAVGEIGLDYHYDFSPRDVQRAVFRKQLELAAEVSLPIVVHSREAFEDTVQILKDGGYAGRPVVFHCYGGTARQAAELRELGWWTSFTGVLTFRNAEGLRQAFLETPIEMLMFETDCPYITPEPIRRVRPNEPRHLVYTVRFAAELRGMSYEELAEASTANAVRFFGLDH